MVKFLCTRQDWAAERLGVQSLTFSGYLCPGTERFGDLDDLSPEADNFNQNTVSGLFLLNKNLFFIQQLTRDTVSHKVIHIHNNLQQVINIISQRRGFHIKHELISLCQCFIIRAHRCHVLLRLTSVYSHMLCVFTLDIKLQHCDMDINETV